MWGVEGKLNHSLPRNEIEVSVQLYRQFRFVHKERNDSTKCIRGWMGPIAGLEVVEKRNGSYLYCE
jgi:hypothetical protein